MAGVAGVGPRQLNPPGVAGVGFPDNEATLVPRPGPLSKAARPGLNPDGHAFSAHESVTSLWSFQWKCACIRVTSPKRTCGPHDTGPPAWDPARAPSGSIAGWEHGGGRQPAGERGSQTQPMLSAAPPRPASRSRLLEVWRENGRGQSPCEPLTCLENLRQ